MTTTVRSSTAVYPVLYIEPGGMVQGAINLQMKSELTPGERVQIADRIASEVCRWRDEIAGRANKERTAADELAAAHAEIARLKAEAEGTS
ncbi:hypothetical protein ABT034_33780 [Streptomyces sp. NPDC002773]|uniref:hypothetical protein n=1 Tax=Streptomyces sp. NPDC002773 TaxID=3154430 RepID=UPI0033297EC8